MLVRFATISLQVLLFQKLLLSQTKLDLFSEKMSPHHIPLSKQAEFFILSQCSIHVSLVRIYLTFHKIYCTQPRFDLNLTYLAPLWPWKYGQGHQNLISSSSCPNVIFMQIWLKSIQ